MSRRTRFAGPFLALLVAARAGAAEPPPPDAFVRTEIDALADLLASGRPDRTEAVRRRVRAAADFDGFARRSLGSAWERLRPPERKRFTEALQRLVESHYLRRPASIFDKRKVSVEGAKRAGDEAEVALKVARKDADVAVEVRLRRAPAGWIAQDVVIDDLSLLEDYRAQFRSYLKKHSVGELIARLNARAKAADGGR